MKQKMVDFLLNNAGPSIVLQVKKEILKDITEKEEQELRLVKGYIRRGSRRDG